MFKQALTGLSKTTWYERESMDAMANIHRSLETALKSRLTADRYEKHWITTASKKKRRQNS